MMDKIDYIISDYDYLLFVRSNTGKVAQIIKNVTDQLPDNFQAEANRTTYTLKPSDVISENLISKAFVIEPVGQVSTEFYTEFSKLHKIVTLIKD